jgi:pimeloyl-ACP methyl ester carboxylesterase
LSDRVPEAELPTLEQRMDDVRAVMDAVGSPRAALLGVSEGGPMCALFAATYPERTEAIVMIGSYARRLRDDDYPWGPTPEEREAFCRHILDAWGGPVGIEVRAPSRAGDPDFRQWWSEYLRMGASPGAAVALTRMNARIDIRHVLPAVRVPALVLHRRGDRCLLADEGRYLARHIPGARFVELEGDDHLPFVGDQQAILDEIRDFLAGLAPATGEDSVLATILVATPIGSGPAGPGDAALAEFEDHARRTVQWFRGRPGPMDAGRLVAAFDGPARAIRCASALAAAAPRFGLAIGTGLHTGECAAGDGAYRGVAVNIGRHIAERAGPGEVLVSRTVTDLVAGSGLRFEDRGVTALGDLGVWRLFVARPPATG